MANIRICAPRTEKAARIICDAGGEIVGRTRLQKIAYLLEATHLGEGFEFEYRHYGPYSEELAVALETAKARGLIKEEERSTNWGGSYSIFTACGSNDARVDQARRAVIETASSADPVSLELAATAAFLAKDGYSDPWAETARRKPEKASRLETAKSLYARLRTIDTPEPLPAI